MESSAHPVMSTVMECCCMRYGHVEADHWPTMAQRRCGYGSADIGMCSFQIASLVVYTGQEASARRLLSAPTPRVPQGNI